MAAGLASRVFKASYSLLLLFIYFVSRLLFLRDPINIFVYFNILIKLSF